MIILLDTVGPAVLRASWQATALALVVTLLFSCFGERLSPKWRFLLWSRLLPRTEPDTFAWWCRKGATIFWQQRRSAFASR
jgi:hypothetical protein